MSAVAEFVKFVVMYSVVAAFIALLVSLPIRAGFRKGRSQLIALGVGAGLIVTGAATARFLAMINCPEFLLPGLLVPVGIVVGALLIGFGLATDRRVVGVVVGGAGTLMALFAGAGLFYLAVYCNS